MRRADILKRAFDVGVALISLVVLSPVMLGVAIAVRLRLGTPVFFRQSRPGQGAAPFVMLKFRTMHDAFDDANNPLPDAARLDAFGRFLRASSLDELPELWNVLRGEMSLVGPRPLLMEYLPLYSPDQRRRHEVRPGITGLAQVSGRNALTWEERFALDVWYVDNRSMWVDLKILWRTLRKVVVREGIAHAGKATMPRFRGSAR